MHAYNSNNTFCPVCGHNIYTTPLFAIKKQGVNFPITYVGLDECTCTNCNDIHTASDRLKTMVIDAEVESNKIVVSEIFDSMKSGYSEKKVNPNYYSTISITDSADDKNTESGIILAPYILSLTNVPDKKYTEFMAKYKSKHKCCPNCGSTDYISTLIGFAFYSDKPDEYKDRNRCVCADCNDRHIVHDRISLNEL